MATASPSDAAAPDVAGAVLGLARSRPATLGGSRLVCVDGPSGSGKTTLAARIAGRAGADAVVVHTDDLLDGWDDLPGLPARLATLLEPLASGRASAYRRYDWHAGAYAEEVAVPPSPLLVVEGVGAGARLLDPWRTVLVWVGAREEVRVARGVARDGAAVEPHLRRWRRAEADHFAHEATAARADLRLDTSGT
ncbi:uridine kinase family protein [Nocardioides pantholopis]|uniref:uridine kinase family protein n=1 Tax=Nocardioides pantholopis TaxID=2483798 RepID=UPI001F49EEEB|nr:4-amino-4-deoxy-L-arabinose transferase [Nocardioides pantholopis]